MIFVLFPSGNIKVFVALGATDMRKSINGLSLLVSEYFDLSPFSGHLFVFCNRRRNILKILYWDMNGFCLWQKRLEKDRFHWPDCGKELEEISHRELLRLIDGIDMNQPLAHKSLTYGNVN